MLYYTIEKKALSSRGILNGAMNVSDYLINLNAQIMRKMR